MLIPRMGFGWVSTPNAVAERGTSECLLSLEAADDAEVDALVERARAAGADVVVEAGASPGASTPPRSPIPTATSG